MQNQKPKQNKHIEDPLPEDYLDYDEEGGYPPVYKDESASKWHFLFWP